VSEGNTLGTRTEVGPDLGDEVAIIFVFAKCILVPRALLARDATSWVLAKSITGYHKNMVRKQYPVLELANQMPVQILIWPEPLVASRVRRALGTRMSKWKHHITVASYPGVSL
jgi:hypothetical protein